MRLERAKEAGEHGGSFSRRQNQRLVWGRTNSLNHRGATQHEKRPVGRIVEVLLFLFTEDQYISRYKLGKKFFIFLGVLQNKI